MIRFIVTKEIEVDDSVFEFEDVGVFDHEEEAKELASTIYNEMPEYEKQYYAVSVWKASGENIDTDDWNTFEECESVDIYPAKAIEGIEESLEDSDNAEITDTAQVVYFCVSPLQDSMRLWVGNDPDKYVDRAFVGAGEDTAFALEDWFEEHGRFQEENWNDCFPQRCRKMYLDYIARQGYSEEESLEIFQYLPLTDSELLSINTSEMIKMWKEKAKIIEPYKTQHWKKRAVHGQEDLWADNIYAEQGVENTSVYRYNECMEVRENANQRRTDKTKNNKIQTQQRKRRSPGYNK